jgi:hypothetical protein
MYLPKEAGVVGEGRVIVSGFGPGAVSAIGKRRDELPMRNLGPHLEDRILVASRYKDGVVLRYVSLTECASKIRCTAPPDRLHATVCPSRKEA